MLPLTLATMNKDITMGLADKQTGINKPISVEDYLKGELDSDIRHEFLGGIELQAVQFIQFTPQQIDGLLLFRYITCFTMQ